MSFTYPESLSHNGVSIALGDEGHDRAQNALNYLLQYGFAKSLQDSVAGVKAKIVAYNAGTASEDDAAIAKDLIEEHGTDNPDHILRAIMEARAEAILAGTVGTRGPRATGPEAVRRAVVAEWFKNWVADQAAKGKSLPNVKDRFGLKKAADASKEQKETISKEIDAIREKFAKAKSAAIEEEVARRLAAKPEEEEELDLDELL